MHPIWRPGSCGPRSRIDECARSGPRRRTTIWGTWPPNASPPFGITHLDMLSIRARVLAAILGLVLIGLVASAGAIYGALQWVLISRLDQQLSSVERPVVTALNQIDRQRQLEGVVPPGSFVKLFDDDGSELYSFSVPEVQEAPPSPMLPSSLPDSSGPFSVGSKTVGDPGYRVEV